MGKSALLLGASGLVGGYLLQQLLDHPNYKKVICVGRRPLGIRHPKLQEKIVALNELESIELSQIDDYYCALGTTIKKAKTKENFREIDLDFVVNGAKTALMNGAKRAAIVSAIGTSSSSPFFYSRTKGEMEDAVTRLGIEKTIFARPSIILGERNEKRLLESLTMKILTWFRFVFLGPFKKYAPVHAKTIAEEMILELQESSLGVSIIYFKKKAPKNSGQNT